jgi:chemotaxis protein MotB
MGNGSNGATIIKRKKKVVGGGHHGGAWKVAYADFVTAMMAFFMLMWLLNATTEQQRKGISDYFAPSIPINRISGGGDGAFGGDNVFTDDTLAQSGTGARQPTLGDIPVRVDDGTDDTALAAQVAALEEIAEILLGNGGESLLSEQALRHVITRLTDEGLIIELFDLPDAQLFKDRSTEPMPVTVEIAGVLARLFLAVTNSVAITGHISARPAPLRDDDIWDVSTGRAAQIRALMQDAGLNPARIMRQTGMGDRKPAAADPTTPRNNRIEVVLLRSDLRESAGR